MRTTNDPSVAAAEKRCAKAEVDIVDFLSILALTAPKNGSVGLAFADRDAEIWPHVV
jgi:hypothetical protein